MSPVFSLLLLPLILLLLLPLRPLHAANLLLISPALSRSLLLAMGRLADCLVLAGHNVTVWIPEMRPIAHNGTRLAQTVIRMRTPARTSFDRVLSGDAFSAQAHSFQARWAQDQAVAEFCETILVRRQELEVLRRTDFQLAFTNMIDLCSEGLVHWLGIPRRIWLSTGALPDSFHWFLGVPQPLSIVPVLQSSVPLGPRMGLWQRAQNIWQFALSWHSLRHKFARENAAFRRHISADFPPLERLAARTSLTFQVGDPFLEPALPTLTKVIHIGGLGLGGSGPSAGQLSRELLAALESAGKGAVLFSLGSAVDTAQLDRTKLGNLLRTFAAFPDYAFVAKVSPGDELSRRLADGGKVPNLHLFDWLPQTDLLAHPRLRLFITHGGANSLLESAVRGVPVLVIPLFFDQLRNAQCAAHRAFARVLAKEDLLKPEKLRSEIAEMLANPSYKSRAQRLAKLHQEKPHRPEEQVIRWTEFVLSQGPLAELVPPSVDMTLWEYYCLDIIAAFGGGLAMLLLIVKGTVGWPRGS